MTPRERLLRLQAVLEAHADFWRPAPFQVRRPAWCAMRPDLADAVLALDDAAVDALAADPARAQAWLTPRLPVVGVVAELCALPRMAERSLPSSGRHFDWAIPGRKRAQIDAFVGCMPQAHAPLLEWCAGKGHLGRRAALADGVAVTSLEIDAWLCDEARRLAGRNRVAQTVVCADALSEAAQRLAQGHEVLALHACGELHRSLVRGAATSHARAYRIAPCCYYRGAEAAGYRPLSGAATLALDERALRLAVTETVTAGMRDRRRLARDQAWKLGFIALRNALMGEAERRFKPVPADWLAADFATCCTALAQREGLHLPSYLDWAHWQAEGERRRAEVRRLELVRHAFRRALETWLVLDLALGLEEAGYTTRVGTFCERALTPRNLMVCADRPY
ncbi:MAG: methyltransferase [Rhodocyclaceae bacterium]